jgi:hypothetical protein
VSGTGRSKRLQVLTVAAALPLLFFLPGFLTLAQERPSDASDAPTSEIEPGLASAPAWIETGLLAVLASALLAAVAATILAILGIYSVWGVMAISAGYCVVAAGGRRIAGQALPLRIRAIAMGGPVVVFAVVIAVSAAILLRPFENVLVFQDPSVYLLSGIHASRTGDMEVEDDLYYTLSAETRDALAFERVAADGFTADFRLDGFHADAEGQRTVPQFFPLTAGWIAIFHSLFGERGALYAVPSLAVLSVGLIFAAAQRLFGTWAAGIATGLLLLNPAEIWWGRNHGSDIVYQCLLFGGLLAWARYDATRRIAAAGVAGAAFGAIALARGDALIVLVPLGAFLAWQWLRGGELRGVAAGIASGLPIFAAAAIVAVTYAWPYTQFQYHAFREGVRIAVIVAAATTPLLLALTAWRRNAIQSWLSGRNLAMARWWVAGGLVGLALFAYFIRPLMAPDLPTLAEEAAASADDESLVQFGWYVTLPGLAAGIGGIAVMIVARRHRAVALLLLLTLAPTIFYLQDTRASADHIWTSRRFIAAAMPLAAIGAGLLIAELWGLGRWRPRVDAQRYAGAAIGAVLLAGTVALTLPNTVPILLHTEQDDAPGQLREINDLIPEREAVVVFSPSFGSGLIAPAYKLAHGRDAYAMRFATGAESRNELFGAALGRGLPTYFVFATDRVAEAAVEPPPDRLALGPYSLERVGAYAIDVPILELRFDAIPRDGVRLQFDGVVYRVSSR